MFAGELERNVDHFVCTPKNVWFGFNHKKMINKILKKKDLTFTLFVFILLCT